MIGKSIEDFRKDYEKQAEESVKSRLVLEAVAKDANIIVSDIEISEKLKEMAEKYGKKEDEIKQNEQLTKYIEESIKTEKSIKYIVDNAKFTKK